MTSAYIEINDFGDRIHALLTSDERPLATARKVQSTTDRRRYHWLVTNADFSREHSVDSKDGARHVLRLVAREELAARNSKKH